MIVGIYCGVNCIYSFDILVSQFVVGINMFMINIVSGIVGVKFLSLSIFFDVIDLVVVN